MASEIIALNKFNDIETCLKTPLARTPASLYSIKEYQLPLSNAEIQGNFGASINPLALTSVDRPPGVLSTFSEGNVIDCTFLLSGIGVHFKVDDFSFTLPGESIVAPAPGSALQSFNGEIPVNVDGTRPATFEQGGPSWRAAIAFLNAYSLEMVLGCKFILFDERATDIGAMNSNTQFCGFGEGMISAAPWIRACNDRQAALLTDKRFIPQTSISQGTVDDPLPDLVLPPPVVPVQWGGPCMGGLWGGLYPTRKVLLHPSCPIRLQFKRIPGEVLWYNRLVNELGDIPASTYDANLTESIVDGVTPVGYGSVQPFKNAILTCGVKFFGWELTPQACIDYYTGEYGALEGNMAELAGAQKIHNNIMKGLNSRGFSTLEGLIQQKQDSRQLGG